MKLLIKDLQKVLEIKSLSQRGILFSALLTKDPNPKFWKAKFNTVVSGTTHRNDLISLHEEKFIMWEGYKNAVKARDNETIPPDVVESITFMNTLYKRRFNPEGENTVRDLRARLNDYSLEEVKMVISNRYIEWKDDKVMRQHLNPGTIFRKSKFEKYIEEAKYTKAGSSIVKAEELGLKDGDDILYSMKHKLVPEETYLIRYYGLKDGNKTGGGVTEQLTGKELKRQLTMQNNKKKYGEQELVYTYLSK